MRRVAFMGAFIGAMLLTAVAIAAPYKFSGAAFDSVARFMKAGFYSGPSSIGSTTNVVTNMLSNQCDEDFPSIPSGYFKINPNLCPLSGAKVGDPCTVVPLGPGDGGTDLVADGTGLECRVKTPGFITIFAYNKLGDGGADDPSDAGYVVRTTSNQ